MMKPCYGLRLQLPFETDSQSLSANVSMQVLTMATDTEEKKEVTNRSLVLGTAQHPVNSVDVSFKRSVWTAVIITACQRLHMFSFHTLQMDLHTQRRDSFVCANTLNT